MLLFHLLVLRKGNCCGRINVHLISLLSSAHIFAFFRYFLSLHVSLSLSLIYTHRAGPFFIATTSAGHMFSLCTLVRAPVHHELVCVSLKERCPGLYLLMVKVCFSDVSNIIPCYQRLICLSQFDSCLFRASGQSQSQSRQQTPLQRLMRSALFILSINLTRSAALWTCFSYLEAISRLHKWSSGFSDSRIPERSPQ